MLSVGNTNNRQYKETEALRQLLLVVDEMLNEEIFCADNDLSSNEQFTINIAGKSIAFYAGETAADALCAFVKSIASENDYAVDINANTVTPIKP